MNHPHRPQRRKFIKILPGDNFDPKKSSLIVLHANPRAETPEKTDAAQPKPLPPENSPPDDQQDHSILDKPGVCEALGNDRCSQTSETSGIARRSPTFRIIHDPGPYPISGERCMTKYEVQYGLRYNTFTRGTIIEDIVTGSHHKVVTRKIFKPASRSCMLALIESYLFPPHPMFNTRAYTKDGKYID